MITILRGIVTEVLLGKQPAPFIGRGLRNRNVAGNILILALFDFFFFEIASIGRGFNRFNLQNLFRLRGHVRELIAVVVIIGNFVRDDQFVLVIRHDLNVIAHIGAKGRGLHKPAVWVGQ